MPIIQDKDVKYPYKQYIYIYYLQAFRSKAIVSQWLHSGFFFFMLSVHVWKCDEGFVHFLHIVAKSPSAFP